MHIANMSAREHSIQIANIPISAVFMCFRVIIDNGLYSLRRLIKPHVKTNDLSQFTANHCYNVYILSCLGAPLFVNKPIEFV